jgi:DNA recombination protein RmuC
MRDHLKALSGKEYWRHFDAPEFVVMFLPTEGLYTMAVSGDPALIEDAARANVILASPTTLMGLLRVVMHGWQQQKMAEEAKTVSALAADLYNRLCAFGDHMQRVGTGLGTAIGAYNKAVGSLENSVLRPARKLRELHVQTGGKELAEMGEIAETARTLEIAHQEKDGGGAEAA